MNGPWTTPATFTYCSPGLYGSASRHLRVRFRKNRAIAIEPLLKQGVRAVGGAAGGPVFVLHKEAAIADIPAGGIVVVRQPDSKLVQGHESHCRHLTEVGSPTDHMTILAREFQVPTLVDVTGALESLTTGQEITMDADRALIYPGIIKELLPKSAKKPEPWRDDPLFAKLKKVLTHISPLHLLDPTSPDFQAKSCATLHDITRFCHEKGMDVMFNLDVEQSVQAKGVCRLQSDLPLNLFILDLGGGLLERDKKIITEEDFCSPTFPGSPAGLPQSGGSLVRAGFGGF